MSLRPDGTYHCDRCGNDIGNAGYLDAMTISGGDPDNNLRTARVLHLCLTRDDTGVVTGGCQGVVLDHSALADYYSQPK